ncbi:MAG: hypothetical protein ACI81L_001011 [Verrucomicrobiales bacterium]|jgi:hypothetical protein
MGSRRQNTTERRLAHVRAIKDEFYADEPSLDEQLETKDQRIVELDREVEMLRLQLLQERKKQHPEPEDSAPASADREPSAFDFYRD